MNLKKDVVTTSDSSNDRVVVLTGYAPKLTGATLSDAIMHHIAKSDVSASPYWVQKQQKKRLQPKR